MQIKTVGVVGAGTMGSGIAELCLSRGFDVRLFDSNPRTLEAAREKIEQGLALAAKKGRISQTQAELGARGLTLAGGLKDLSSSSLVIEAASEDLRIKSRIFKELGAAGPDTILATNTSSLPVWAMAQAAAAPQRVLGLHFFNPPVIMKLVEVAKTSQTREECFKAAWEFVAALGKTPVEVKDTPGFIVNRIIRPYFLTALRLANEGAGIAAVDRAARAQGGAPIGPFELIDLIGLDVNLAIGRVLYEAFGAPARLRPSTIQEWLVKAGSLGRKAGKGFYLYDGSSERRENPEVLALLPEPRPLKPEAIWERLISAMAEEAQAALAEGVAKREDIDLAIKLATNFHMGPFEWFDAIKNLKKS